MRREDVAPVADAHHPLRAALSIYSMNRRKFVHNFLYRGGFCRSFCAAARKNAENYIALSGLCGLIGGDEYIDWSYAMSSARSLIGNLLPVLLVLTGTKGGVRSC